MKTIKYMMLPLIVIVFLPLIILFSGIKFIIDLTDDGFKKAIERFWEGY